MNSGPLMVRLAAAAAATWALAFAALNVWVQYVAIDPGHVMAEHLVGLAVLNGIAIVLKCVGVGVALSAAAATPRRANRLTALAAATVSTLAIWGVAGVVTLVVSGGATTTRSLAGGALSIPGWTYPAFFLLGALLFAVPARHVATHSRAPRRHVLVGAVAGPPAVVAAIVGTAQLLAVAGLLP